MHTFYSRKRLGIYKKVNKTLRLVTVIVTFLWGILNLKQNKEVGLVYGHQLVNLQHGVYAGIERANWQKWGRVTVLKAPDCL